MKQCCRQLKQQLSLPAGHSVVLILKEFYIRLLVFFAIAAKLYHGRMLQCRRLVKQQLSVPAGDSAVSILKEFYLKLSVFFAIAAKLHCVQQQQHCRQLAEESLVLVTWSRYAKQ